MTILPALRSRTATARSAIDRRMGERATLTARRAELEAALTASRVQVETITQAAILLREASDYARQRALEQVQGLTSSALQSVFGPSYQFKLESGESAGRPTVTCQVVTPFGDGDTITTEGVDSRGGGTIDIQALALRWAMLETHRPGIDGPLILDEPAKHVSEEYVGPTGRFLRGACDTFGRQVVMVTHNPSLAGLADQVVQVSMVDGASRVQ